MLHDLAMLTLYLRDHKVGEEALFRFLSGRAQRKQRKRSIRLSSPSLPQGHGARILGHYVQSGSRQIQSELVRRMFKERLVCFGLGAELSVPS